MRDPRPDPMGTVQNYSFSRVETAFITVMFNCQSYTCVRNLKLHHTNNSTSGKYDFYLKALLLIHLL